ncbi:MAG: outer membrane protein assembly factor BamD [Spirochaetaceae bacterium]|jgi:tetratricopeptide (TPR) repeat protein|nr:outer membrane protein assembly factor BamD [Spirochaetaceae bacterium]
MKGGIFIFFFICAGVLEAQEMALPFSRTARVQTGQMVEIPYRGTGWVYLGELSGQRGITYEARRIDPEGQSFIFSITSAGTFTLKFYRQDFILDSVINDYIMITALDPPRSAASSWFRDPEIAARVVVSPRWPPADAFESAVFLAEEESDSRADTFGDYLRLARQAYKTKQIPEALSFMDKLVEQYPAGSDEVWWLYGQLLEAQGSTRDVRSAFDYYSRLVQDYPHSPRAALALKRIAYLERYYFFIQ